jgi:hypothetical protein
MDTLTQIPLTLCMNKAGFVAGTTNTTSITASPLAYIIQNKHFTRATVTNGATPTLDGNTGLAFAPVLANQGSVFVFGYNAAGVLSVYQGQVAPLDITGLFINSPQMPVIPDAVCPYGYLIIRAGSTAVGSWTLGVNNMSGVTGITYTFVDIANIPPRPQVS